MRATLGDVARHPSWLPDWWVELPARRRWWWREVLWQPGAGWLRWKGDMVDFGSSSYWDPPDLCVVFPPARRLWLRVRRGIAMHELMDPERPRLFR